MGKLAKVQCFECGATRLKEKMFSLEVHDRPFDEVPRTIYVCKEAPAKFKKEHVMPWLESCEELLTDTGWADFRYFTCSRCDRMICTQNPSNGWHTQYRMVDDEQICLKCFEEIVLRDGIDRKRFEEGSLLGMFFSWGNTEPEGSGYEEVEGFSNYSVRNNEAARRVCDKAIELIDSGYKVIVAYESIAIGGLEGYVTLMSKKHDEQ